MSQEPLYGAVSQDGRHSFVIRIWNEGLDSETGGVIWRGTITHIASGERTYFLDGEALIGFIEKYAALPRQKTE